MFTFGLLGTRHIQLPSLSELGNWKMGQIGKESKIFSWEF